MGRRGMWFLNATSPYLSLSPCCIHGGGWGEGNNSFMSAVICSSGPLLFPAPVDVGCLRLTCVYSWVDFFYSRVFFIKQCNSGAARTIYKFGSNTLNSFSWNKCVRMLLEMLQATYFDICKTNDFSISKTSCFWVFEIKACKLFGAELVLFSLYSLQPMEFWTMTCTCWSNDNRNSNLQLLISGSSLNFT